MGIETPEFMMRVKLPSSGGFAACPSGDSEYEEAFHNAIKERLPVGFEVSWATRSTWPKDRDGYSWVRLYCTDEKNAMAKWMKEAHDLAKKMTELKEAIRKIGM